MKRTKQDMVRDLMVVQIIPFIIAVFIKHNSVSIDFLKFSFFVFILGLYFTWDNRFENSNNL